MQDICSWTTFVCCRH